MAAIYTVKRKSNEILAVNNFEMRIHAALLFINIMHKGIPRKYVYTEEATGHLGRMLDLYNELAADLTFYDKFMA